MIAIIDYGLGNLASVQNAFRAVGAEVERTSSPETILNAAGVVLPGVGAAPSGMERLRFGGLDHVIREVVTRETPFLGLCLGMQLLFEWSEEGKCACLGLLPGHVPMLRQERKIPHIGWNKVVIRRDTSLFRNLPPDPYFYFVHSYICVPSDQSVVAGETVYGETFCSAVESGSVWGTQFHPERSGATGLRLIANFAEACALRPSDIPQSVS